MGFYSEKLDGFCPNYLPPPPNFHNLYNFFSDVKIQDLKVSLDLKILYILYNMLYIYNLNKKQLKIQIIGILEGVDSFY